MIVVGDASQCKRHEDIGHDVPMERLGVYIEHFFRCVIPRLFGAMRRN